MSPRRLVILTAMSASTMLAIAPSASAALTLGSTTAPEGAVTIGCGSNVIAEAFSDPTTPYAVPAGGGEIVSWQVSTVGAAPGSPVTFVVVRRIPSNRWVVVGSDSVTLPTPLPAGNIATFSLPTPIVAQAGDTLGLYTPSGGLGCYFDAGSTPVGDSLAAITPAGTPAAGQTLTMSGTESGERYMMAETAFLVQPQDAAVTTAAGPSGATAGNAASLVSSVSNNGPETGPIAFSDVVPAGLAVKSATAGSNSCVTSGQLVTCNIAGLAAGQSIPVIISVVPAAAATYTNTVSVAAAHDPNLANNSASASLTVGPPSVSAPLSCLVPTLVRTPQGLAEKALGLLGCSVGKVTKTASKTIPKGTVISTSPGVGTYGFGTAVKLKVSSGKPKKHKRHHHGKRHKKH